MPSNGVNYSGGAQNFVRFPRNWTDKTFTYYGSMLGLYASKQAIGAWAIRLTTCGNQKWYFDTKLSIDSSGNPVSVPGYVSTVAYLQQQRCGISNTNPFLPMKVSRRPFHCCRRHRFGRHRFHAHPSERVLEGIKFPSSSSTKRGGRSLRISRG